VDATLPYFIPAPIPLTGTLGAVIKIREAFPTRTVLFDIGVAGPIAGFVVLVPALFYGLSISNLLPEPTDRGHAVSGRAAALPLGGGAGRREIPDGLALNIHPIVFAAWFGMLATAINLLPFGQLDGGHITYATAGRLATPISLATVLVAVAMNFVFSTSWAFMTLMMLLMLVFFGARHPRVIYEYEPLGPGRHAIAVLALIILVICFTPAPIEFYDLVRNP
jgi:membrane-associated protease RseP (regulator of RpoE activity)